MNNRYLCCFDFETGSADKNTCQIIQIAGAIIDDRSLKVLDTFNAWVQPDFNAEGCEQKTLQWHADNRKEPVETFVEFLKQQATIDLVWPKWVSWVDRYNKSSGNITSFMAPIPCGYNIVGFDIPILERYCKKYGPLDNKGNQRLLNSVFNLDIMQHFFFWTENIDDPEVKTKLRLVDIRVWLGFDIDRINAAHNALEDVMDCVDILKKLFQVERFLTTKRAVEIDGKIYSKRRLEMKDSCKVK